MTDLNRAELPERLKDKDYDFKVKRGLLSQSVEALGPIIQSGNEKAIKESVETIHSNYQALEKIF